MQPNNDWFRSLIAGLAFVMISAFTSSSVSAQTQQVSDQQGETSRMVEDNRLTLEAGLFSGAHFFADDLELGVPDAPGLVSSPQHGAQFGLRLGVRWRSWFSAELEAASIPTKDRLDGIGTIITAYKAHALVYFLQGPLRPFALLGGGLMHVASTEGLRGMGTIRGQGIQFTDIDPEIHAGAGVKYNFSDRIAARFDARAVLLPDYARGTTVDWETLLGFSYSFGSRERPSSMAVPESSDENLVPAAPVAPATSEPNVDPESNPAPDPEPLVGREAQPVPTVQAEAVEIAPDSDGAVAPAPLSAPAVVVQAAPKAADSDRDGVPDDVDRCPDRPEDKDRFQDFDGCPEFDNDQDGIVDTADRCPYEAENRNGYQDDDACPDELPVELQPLIGTADGVFFATKSAQIQTEAFVVLGSLVQALNKYPEIRVLAEGHASGEGDRKRELGLAQARADATRAFLIALGIRPDRIEVQAFSSERPIEPNVGPRARDRNRRVVFKLLPPGASTQP